MAKILVLTYYLWMGNIKCMQKSQKYVQENGCFYTESLINYRFGSLRCYFANLTKSVFVFFRRNALNCISMMSWLSY